MHIFHFCILHVQLGSVFVSAVHGSFFFFTKVGIDTLEKKSALYHSKTNCCIFLENVLKVVEHF